MMRCYGGIPYYEPCPDCDPDNGYYVNYVGTYSQYYDFDNKPVDATPFNIFRGGKVAYCANCDRRLKEKFIEPSPNGI
jgi:hypothetical protein